MNREGSNMNTVAKNTVAKNTVAKDNVVIGPICTSEYSWQWCGHESCGSIEAIALCPMKPGVHGMQEIVDGGSFTGFAGGRCYYTELACGCIDMDETNDVNAAY
jgi:hypothetical protein